MKHLPARLALFVAAFTGIVLSFPAMGESVSISTLDDVRWERRVIVVFTDSSGASEAAEALHEEKAALADRDLSAFVVLDGVVVSHTHPGAVNESLGERLTERLAPRDTIPDVLLIGLDGGLKARLGTLDLQALFDEIDTMPMRRRELRQRSELPVDARDG